VEVLTSGVFLAGACQYPKDIPDTVAQASGAAEASIEVRDNGPGVPAENRAEIFKPYFTTQQKGTGLGLAIVQQIVQAHGWEIACLANTPQGAIFRITHLKLAAKHG
jgi:signal transduction histidine kinase